MKKHYDFSKGIKNPYAKMFKKQVTIRIDLDTLTYFQRMGNEVGLPYQSLVNLYLRDCVQRKRRLKFT